MAHALVKPKSLDALKVLVEGFLRHPLATDERVQALNRVLSTEAMAIALRALGDDEALLTRIYANVPSGRASFLRAELKARAHVEEADAAWALSRVKSGIRQVLLSGEGPRSDR